MPAAELGLGRLSSNLPSEHGVPSVDLQPGASETVPLVPLVNVQRAAHLVPACADLFDARDRSILIAGDTAPSDIVVTLARGANAGRIEI